MTREKWYDEIIAPKLAEIGEECVKRGVPFLAVVEYQRGSRGETKFLPVESGIEMVMIGHCIKTAPNIDGYMIGLKRYADENGIDTSASLYMHAFDGGTP